jgi:hypothetical protein
MSRTSSIGIGSQRTVIPEREGEDQMAVGVGVLGRQDEVRGMENYGKYITHKKFILMQLDLYRILHFKQICPTQVKKKQCDDFLLVSKFFNIANLYISHSG